MMKVLALALMILSGEAFAQSYQSAMPPFSDGDAVQMCQGPNCNAGSPSKTVLGKLNDLATYMATKIQRSNGNPVGTFVIAGANNAATGGAYAVPAGVPATAKLIIGFAVNGNVTANDNFGAVPYVLVSDAINPMVGWHLAGNTITDPKIIDWSGWFLVFIYQ